VLKSAMKQNFRPWSESRWLATNHQLFKTGFFENSTKLRWQNVGRTAIKVLSTTDRPHNSLCGPLKKQSLETLVDQGYHISGFSLTCPGFWWPNMRQGEMLNSASLSGILE